MDRITLFDLSLQIATPMLIFAKIVKLTNQRLEVVISETSTVCRIVSKDNSPKDLDTYRLLLYDSS